MGTTADVTMPARRAAQVVGHPEETVPAEGTYRCLCCGVMLWYLRRGQRFPECPSNNCPTMWLLFEP